ncbi:MAG TPA: HAMP domain-containing sensor histidine kinase [Nocardioidaceae bacterium]|nr:HAMP domain-containing sensor histidine kinase [Nocardioidaceae bacterium]
MRDRLVVAFVSLTLAVVAVFLVERAYTTSALIHEQEQRKVERSATVIAALLGDARVEVTPELLEGLLFADEHAVYVDADGDRVEAADHVTDDTPEGQDVADLTVTREVAGGGALTLSRHADVVDERVADALLPLALVALALVVAAVVAAVWISARLTRPFRQLADVAARIGRGDFGVEVPRSRVPEADSVARALRASAQDLGSLVQRERDFAAHASHELRTPITATRLELEDLALAPQTSPEVVSRVSAAIGQLDRLSATVAEMLDASRESRVGARVDIDLAALVRDSVSRWQQLALGRTVDLTCGPVVAVRLPAGSLMQLLDILIGNAVTHGEGRVTVTLAEAPEYVDVRVADEGPRQVAAEAVRQPVAGGLATAVEIAESLGGQLRLTEDARTTFSLVLPRR